MIFDSFPIQVLGEWPESIQVNFITESRGKRIHEQTCAGPFDGDFVRQPVTGKRKCTQEKHLETHSTSPTASILCIKQAECER